MPTTKYNPPKVEYDIGDGIVISKEDYRGKVSGTMMAGILECSPWSTPFQVACNLLGFASADISDKPSVKAGKDLEGTVIRYVGEQHKDIGLFLPAEVIFEPREGDHDEWAPDFEDEYFTGHVDGIVMNENGEQYILEVKTSSNMDAWVDGVPDYYFWQVALYNEFITKQDKAYVALGIMDPEALKDPSTWVPSPNNTALFEIKIDREVVAEVLDKVRIWYDAFIAQGITPIYDQTKIGDCDMFSHLKCLLNGEDDVQELIDELASIRNDIAIAEAEIGPLYAREDDLKNKLKDYLTSHDIKNMTSTSGHWSAVISETIRRKVDATKLKEAGIDPEPYTVETVSKSFTIKKVKME